ncbi:MAG: AIR synthase-related protein, partial [Pseudomonadota bacterium]|nr:AIR synthase-related protein [Pseudomonadota bacterium]
AGLTSSSVEMASKGGLGMEMDLDLVPAREEGMSAYELMLSESQERMLMVLKPDATDTARQIFEKWDLDFMPIGKVTDTGRLVLLKDGETACDIPLAPLVDDAPEYDRPQADVPARPILASADVAKGTTIGDALVNLLASVDLASRRWIYEQYDSQVMADTIAPPGGDAGLVRVHGSQRGIAVTTDCTPRYVEADPRTGGAQAVAEAWRNLSAIGARGLAITNNLNFGNPEKPDIMAQLAKSVLGMGDAARILDTPVVSGNVSLYNETDGRAILPCPVVGMVGTIDEISSAVGMAPAAGGLTLVVIGQSPHVDDGWLGVSLYARNMAGAPDAAPPPVDLEAELRNGLFVQRQIATGLVSAAHDISDGGLAVAIAEMCIAGGLGASIDVPDTGNIVGWAFGEDQARYVVATSAPDELLAAAHDAGVPAAAIGSTRTEAELQFGNENAISVEGISKMVEATIPTLMQGG